jgi:hypothetical protein
MDPPVSLPLLDKLLAAAAQVLFTLRGWIDGWMDGWNCVAVEVLPSREIFSRLISSPVPPSNLRMAIQDRTEDTICHYFLPDKEMYIPRQHLQMSVWDLSLHVSVCSVCATISARPPNH